MLRLCTEIARTLGRFEGLHVTKPEPKLLKSKRVIGPHREILEVQNSIKAYDQIQTYNPRSAKSLKEAATGLLCCGWFFAEKSDQLKFFFRI